MLHHSDSNSDQHSSVFRQLSDTSTDDVDENKNDVTYMHHYTLLSKPIPMGKKRHYQCLTSNRLPVCNSEESPTSAPQDSGELIATTLSLAPPTAHLSSRDSCHLSASPSAAVNLSQDCFRIASLFPSLHHSPAVTLDDSLSPVTQLSSTSRTAQMASAKSNHMASMASSLLSPSSLSSPPLSGEGGEGEGGEGRCSYLYRINSSLSSPASSPSSPPLPATTATTMGTLVCGQGSSQSDTLSDKLKGTLTYALSGTLSDTLSGTLSDTLGGATSKSRTCPSCDKVYVSLPAYSMHVRTHRQGSECPYCGKRFSRVGHLIARCIV